MSLVIYTTSITLPARQRGLQEHLIRTLSTLRIPYTVCDVSMDDDGRRLWRRKGRTDGRLPGFLVDGEYVGTLEEYEYAVEDGRVPDFLGVAKPGPAPPVAPRTYTPAPPPSALPPPSPPKPTHQNPQYLSRTLPLGTSVLAKSTPRPSQEAGAGAARAKRADDDEVDGLVEQAGEDELEQLLRELEGN